MALVGAKRDLRDEVESETPQAREEMEKEMREHYMSSYEVRLASTTLTDIPRR